MRPLGRGRAFLSALAVAPALCWSLPAGAADRIAAAVAAFDNVDTSGEAAEATEAHAARVEGFADLLRDGLAAEGTYRIVPLACEAPPCSAGAMTPDDLVAAARTAGARVLIYGGVHKMSTLVQSGKVQALDLETRTLLLDRTFSFRGDNDEAFGRAADFILPYLVEAAPEE